MVTNDSGRPQYETFDNMGTDIDTHQFQRLRAAQYDVTASRAKTTVYQNTTGKVMLVDVTASESIANGSVVGGTSACVESATPPTHVADSYQLVNPMAIPLTMYNTAHFTVPVNFYYKYTGLSTIVSWLETLIF